VPRALRIIKSKYLDLYDKTRTAEAREKVSILDDIDFELELIHRDEINVVYILKLLGRLKDSQQPPPKKVACKAAPL